MFTEYRDSLDAVQRRLHIGRAISVLHGSQDHAERRAHLRRFLDGDASVLLATDVAGQGLNLQSRAHWVVSLELPWNPARLEQRLGRVDRIGQTGVPHLTMLVARHRSETGHLQHLAKRVLTARRSFADDALASLMPAEATVRDALLQSRVLPNPPEAVRRPQMSLPTTMSASFGWTHWRRRALVVARAIVRRRALCRRWRTREQQQTRIMCAPGNGRVLCSVPVLNNRDELVARLAIAVRIAPWSCAIDRDLAGLRCAIEQFVQKQVTRYVRKIARHLTAGREGLIARETAVTSWTRATGLPGEIQGGLFDSRAACAAQAAIDNVTATSRASSQALTRWSDEACVRAGAVSLEVLWIPRA